MKMSTASRSRQASIAAEPVSPDVAPTIVVRLLRIARHSRERFGRLLAVGFATTVAEPALTAVAGKAEEVSEGSIRQALLRGFVALGVGVGILLGTYRIIHGDSIVYYILVGYIVVIIMTFFAPRTIIPIAYDSGGVTTSTITVPIVAALGLGLATSIEGRDPLIDGFGLIAFASLFPMIAVLGYGISKREAIRFHERRLLRLEQQTMTSMSQHLDADLDGDGIDDSTVHGVRHLKRKVAG